MKQKEPHCHSSKCKEWGWEVWEFQFYWFIGFYKTAKHICMFSELCNTPKIAMLQFWHKECHVYEKQMHLKGYIVHQASSFYESALSLIHIIRQLLIIADIRKLRQKTGQLPLEFTDSVCRVGHFTQQCDSFTSIDSTNNYDMPDTWGFDTTNDVCLLNILNLGFWAFESAFHLNMRAHGVVFIKWCCEKWSTSCNFVTHFCVWL